MGNITDRDARDYDVLTNWLPCCDRQVRLYVPHRDGIQLHERTCKTCGRIWTFATERETLTAGEKWATGTSIKAGRPTVPAVGEVLSNPREDGWIDAHDEHQMLRLKTEVKAGRL